MKGHADRVAFFVGTIQLSENLELNVALSVYRLKKQLMEIPNG
jgi:hypothetical protein